MNSASERLLIYLVGGLLCLVLVGLVWQSELAAVRERRHDAAIRLIHRISGNEARLGAVLHQFRGERYHNYDHLHRLMQRIDDDVRALHEPQLGLYGRGVHGFDFALESYARAQLFRRDLVEHFMRDLAIYKNSLSYLYATSSRASDHLFIDAVVPAEQTRLVRLLHDLQREVLVAAARDDIEVARVDALLTEIGGQLRNLPPDVRQRIDRLLQHSRLVLEYMSIVSGLLDQVNGLGLGGLLANVEGRFVEYDKRQVAASLMLRWFLYPLAVLVLLYLMRSLVRGHRAEDHLWQQMRTADETLESLDEGVLVVDRQARILMMNRVATELTGWPEDMALGQDFADIVMAHSPVTQQPLQRSVEDSIGRETPIRLSQRLRLENRGGDLHWVKFSVAPLYESEHECRGAVVVLRRSRRPSELGQGRVPRESTTVSEISVFEARLDATLSSAADGRLLGAICHFGFGRSAPLQRDRVEGSGRIGQRVREQMFAWLQRDDEFFAEAADGEFVALLLGTDGGQLMERCLDLRERLSSADWLAAADGSRPEVNLGLVLIYHTGVAAANLMAQARSAYSHAGLRGEHLYLTEVAA